MEPELLGRRIREARERIKLSQEDLAIAVSKDQHAISQYENGKRKLAVTDLPAFARALKVPVSYFFEGFDTASSEGLDDAIIDIFRRLPTLEAKEAAIQLLRIFSDTIGLYVS